MTTRPPLVGPPRINRCQNKNNNNIYYQQNDFEREENRLENERSYECCIM